MAKKGTSKAALQRAIRKQTAEVNMRYREAKRTGTLTPQLMKMFETAQLYGSKPRDTRSQIVGLGFGKHTHKSELMRQLRELNRIVKHDIWSPQGAVQVKEEESKAYSTFNERTRYNWSYDKWKSFVDIFGSAPDEILNGFGYERKGGHKGSSTVTIKTDSADDVTITGKSLIEAFDIAYEKRVDLLTVMEEVYSESKGMDQQGAIDSLFERLREIQR